MVFKKEDITKALGVTLGVVEKNNPSDLATYFLRLMTQVFI